MLHEQKKNTGNPGLETRATPLESASTFSSGQLFSLPDPHRVLSNYPITCIGRACTRTMYIRCSIAIYSPQLRSVLSFALPCAIVRHCILNGAPCSHAFERMDVQNPH